MYKVLQSKLLFWFLGSLSSFVASATYQGLLDAQFLNITDDNSLLNGNGKRFETVRIKEAQLKDWYSVSIALNTAPLQKAWVDIKNASEVLPNQFEHGFTRVNFSRPVPFFGRYINSFVLTTAGALLTAGEDMNDSSLPSIPNFIAPFLTSIPPSDRDTVIFYDRLSHGEDFVVQWDRHFGDDDDNRIHIQLRILLDGSMTFLYQNFQIAGKDLILSKGYPILIGLQDGFSVMDMDKPKEMTVYKYPQVMVSPEQIVGHPWAMVTLSTEQGLCHSKSVDECTDECSRCQDTCLYNIELHRSGSPCNTQDECHQVCPLSYEPICGSDGTTYSNLCTMQAKACSSKVEITTVNQGECQNAPDKDRCGKCPKILNPVCGSDNKTYASPCILDMMSCKQKANVTIASNSACPLNDFIYDKTDNEENDEEDDDKVAIIDNCQKKCTKNLQPVCLNGHRSFPNKCTMEVVICQENIAVTTVTDGHCPEEEICDSKGCPLEDNPVCGSNGITYRNDCIVKKLNCEKKMNIQIQSRGNCPETAQKSNPDSDVVKCRSVCPRHFMPCCGSDGKTYNNRCLLDVASCKDNSIKFARLGDCSSQEFDTAAASDTDLSASAKNEQGGEEERHFQAKSSRLGVVVVVSIGLVGALSYFVFHLKKRQAAKTFVPASISTAKAYHDDDEDSGSASINTTSSAASFPNNSGSAELSPSDNWRRPPKQDKLKLVQHMEHEDLNQLRL